MGMCLETMEDSVREADDLSVVSSSLTFRNVRCSIASTILVQLHKFRARNKLDLHSDPQKI